MGDLFAETGPALAACARLAALTHLLIAAQWLHQRRLFEDGGELGWPMLRRTRRLLRCPVLQPFLGHPGLLVVVAVRAAAAVVVLVGPAEVRLAGLTLLLGTSLLAHLRVWWLGLPGGDRILLQVTGALWLAGLDPRDPIAGQAALWFIAGQAVLSYVTAGAGKMASGSWRTGNGLADLARSPLYCSPGLAGWIGRHPIAARIGAALVIAFQLTFPLVLVSGWPGCLVFLAAGLVFHLSVVFLLRLVPFLWAWTSTYPALIYCALRLS